MNYENWLETDYLNLKSPDCSPLEGDIETDCLVVGAGITGLHAALRLIDSGRKVVLLEKTICGGSASGKSGGFLTPDSEKGFEQLVTRHGEEKAKIIYEIPSKG